MENLGLTPFTTKNLASAPVGITADYTYDPLGRRIKKEVTHYALGIGNRTLRTTYVWDSWNLLYEKCVSAQGVNQYERKYAWGVDVSGSTSATGGVGGLLFLTEKRGIHTITYAPVYDTTGNVVAVTDGSGNVVAEYEWGPYGELRSMSGAWAALNPIRWATRYLDEETDLYYFGYRYYDPATGSWLSREPLGESESLNLYSYCHNDPVNKVDVLGLKEQVIAGSDPVYATDPSDPLSVFIGFPLEEDGWFSPFAPNGKHSFASIPVTGEAAAVISAHPEMLAKMRASASGQLDVKRMYGQVFYISNSLQAVAGTGEMAAGIAAAPESAGISMVATVHGADVAGTALNRLWYGPDVDIQSNTSQILQYIPGIDRGKAEIGDSLISLVSAGGSMYVAGRAPLAFVPGAGTGTAGSSLADWHNSMNARYTWSKPPGGHWTQGVSHQLRKKWGMIGSGKELHHWLVPQKSWGKLVPNYIKNRPWNLKVAGSRAAHARIDTAFSVKGVTPYPLLVRPWMAMPNWARATTVGGGIGIGYGISEGLDNDE